MSFKKILILSFVLLLSLSLFTACGRAEKFQKGNISITLTEDFTEKPDEAAQFYYESPDVVVLGTKTSSQDLEKTGDEYADSFADYIQSYMSANGISQNTTINEEKDFFYIETTERLNDTDYAYLISFYENEGDYWVVRFACYKEAYPSFEKNMKKWAQSVSFAGE